MAGGTFPTSVPSYPTISASETLGSMAGGIGHKQTHTNEEADIAALAAKVGTGASTAAANQLLRGTGTGVTAWGSVQAADMAAGAAMVKLGQVLANGTSGVMSVTGIPSTYGALYLEWVARTVSTGGGEMWLAFESTPSSTLYNFVVSYADQTALSTWTGFQGSHIFLGYAASSSHLANSFATGSARVPNYASTNTWKTANAHSTSLSSHTATFEAMTAGVFESLSAISVVRLGLSTAENFATGSKLTVWGLPV